MVRSRKSNVLLLAHVVARAGDYKWAEGLITHQKETASIRYLCKQNLGWTVCGKISSIAGS